MELFKNLHDRTNLLIMLVFMVANILGGLLLSSNLTFMSLLPLGFMASGSMIFLFIYPYQMARTDYRNKVMSLLIASGVSRVQYYFVKIGATLLFSFLSVLLVIMIPLFVVVVAMEGISDALKYFNIVLEIDAGTFGAIFFTWLSAFSILMTSVIISRGRGFTVFVFLGIYFFTNQIAAFINSDSGILWNLNFMEMIIQHIIIIVLMGFIGILILRKQDL